MEDADRRIDTLAATGRLDPALMLTLAKAYAKAKETDVTKEEVKDIMVHLYMQVGPAGCSREQCRTLGAGLCWPE